jgi:hypothetical protein
MKKLIYLLTLSLFVCLSCSKDEPIEIVNQDEMSALEFERVPFMIQAENAKLNDNSLRKSENNGNGVYIVPFYSDDGRWYAEFPIYDQDQNLTHAIIIDFPPNGEDRALVFSETEMMVNFTSHGPRILIYEFGVGYTYYNYCYEDNRDGIYKGRGKTEYIPVDRDGDGNIDFYYWGPYAGTTADKNYIFHFKSTLTSTSAECGDSTIDFSYTYQSANGKLRITSSLN